MKVYTKQEVRAMRRGPSLYAPVIVNFLSGRTMLFHDAEGGSIRIADDVTPEDASHIWVRYQATQRDIPTDHKQFTIKGSTGTAYTVTVRFKQWSCTCSGFGFRKRCKHVEQAKQLNS